MKTTLINLAAFFCLTFGYSQSEVNDTNPDATQLINISNATTAVSANTAYKFSSRSSLTATETDVTSKSPTNETLRSSWTAYGLGYSTPGYYKENDRVYLRGLLRKAGAMTPGEVIFILPEGYRPTARKLCAGAQVGNNIRVDIMANGEVKYMEGTAGTRNYLSLEGISFDIN